MVFGNCPNINMAINFSGPTVEDGWNLCSCFTGDSSWVHGGQSFTAFCSLFAICSLKNRCVIVSYIHSPPRCPAKVGYWNRYIILVRNATRTYFSDALTTVACHNKISWRSYVDYEIGNPTVWEAAWHSWYEDCACRKSYNVQVFPFIVCVVELWEMTVTCRRALLTIPTVS